MAAALTFVLDASHEKTFWTRAISKDADPKDNPTASPEQRDGLTSGQCLTKVRCTRWSILALVAAVLLAVIVISVLSVKLGPKDKSSASVDNAAPPLTEVRTNPFPSYPEGPYITLTNNSEMVALPEPSNVNPPSRGTVGTNCPHLLDGLYEWNDPSTWNDGLAPSTPDAHVAIPEGKKVLISQTIPIKLGLITIPSNSELVVGSDTEELIKLDVKGMVVYGKLTVGSETCRLNKTVTITLHGKRPADITTLVNSDKGIDVNGGIINLHGRRYFHTWSRLAKMVEIGDTVVLLQNKVNWEPGQEIVIVTSSVKDSRDYNQNEVRTILAVHDNPPVGVGAIVYLTEPVQYLHLANKHYQVEVGLLTRTVKVQGAAEDSLPTDPDLLNCKTPRTVRDIQSYDTQPCEDRELTGFGGHIMVHMGGKGYVEGVELFRMGQTNILGRYPMHFHQLGNCPECYLRDSSIHKSFYRCVSIHGTHNTTVTENVAYDIKGFCYYLEDGVEENNTISFNLAAHIHTIGPIPWTTGQRSISYDANENLVLPADISASGYYITNVHNYLIGNAASGGWAGFSFPGLGEPIGLSRGSKKMRPTSVTALTIDGNTAHSTAWWWQRASAFYFGGALFYGSNEILQYNPARTPIQSRDGRDTCLVNMCSHENGGDCSKECPISHWDWVNVTNSKAFLTGGSGMNSWSGRFNVIGFESHDNRLAIESLSEGFWISNLLSVCRTGEDLNLPEVVKMKNNPLPGNGFNWYDTNQEHIMTNTIFRNCGYRSDSYDQYDRDPNRGCDGNDKSNGCDSSSSVFGFVTHSDQFVPEIMQGTKNVTFQNCGRRFRFQRQVNSTSARLQNWLDVDGTITNFNEPSLIGSGKEESRGWWHVDDNVVFDPQGPLRFIRKNDGPKRALGYFQLSWDLALHRQVGKTICTTAGEKPCDAFGHIRHLGRRFGAANDMEGLPVTANPEIVGLTGGYGWLLTFVNGVAPRILNITRYEIEPDSMLLLHIPYPVGTIFDIRAGQVHRGDDEKCRYYGKNELYRCVEHFQQVQSIEEVRDGPGNLFYVHPNGVLTIRIIRIAPEFVGDPDFFVPDYDTPGRSRQYALDRFERGGVRLPKYSYGSSTMIWAMNCDRDGGDDSGEFCTDPVDSAYDPDVCESESGYVQTSYDTCCQATDMSKCMYADGSRSW